MSVDHGYIKAQPCQGTPTTNLHHHPPPQKKVVNILVPKYPSFLFLLKLKFT